MLRKIALITCLAMVMSLPIPMWTATRAMLATQSAHSLYGWSALVLAYIFSAILPAFYFALYRNEGTLRIPGRLRFLCLAGAVAGGIVVAAGVSQWAGSFQISLATAKMLLSEFASLACILLLITFFRITANRPYTDVPISRLLNVMARVAVIAGGIWITINVIGLVLTWRIAARAGRSDMTTGAIRTLLEQACLFTAPYIVFRSALRRPVAMAIK
jgi:hypothetical protein